MTGINAMIVQYFYQQVKLMKFQSVKNYWDQINCFLSNFHHVAQKQPFY